MIKFMWVFMISFLAVMVEIWCAGVGFIFPGVFFLSFYLAVSYNKIIGALAGAIACVVGEIILGRATTALPMLVPLLLYAKFWSSSGDRRYFFAQSISGALIGFCYYVFCHLRENLNLSFLFMLKDFSFILSVIATTGISAVGLPLMLSLLDFISQKIDMNIFCRKDTVTQSSL